MSSLARLSGEANGSLIGKDGGEFDFELKVFNVKTAKEIEAEGVAN